MAAAICICAFVYLTFVGYGLVSALNRGRTLLLNVLVAPAAGASAIIIPALFLNRIGVPIRDFGWILLTAAAALSLGLIVRFRPVFPFRAYWPFLIVFAVAFFLTGRPLIEYGFNWVSFANGDMTFYTLAATRMFEHGFFSVPGYQQVVMDKDPSALMWFLYTAYNGAREGAELLLSLFMCAFHFDAFQLYMPMAVCTYLILISSAAALPLANSSKAVLALVVGGLMALSSLSSLAVLAQLAPQVLGWAIACAAVAMLSDLRPMAFGTLRLVQYGILLAVLLSGEAIVSPETLPFLALALLRPLRCPRAAPSAPVFSRWASCGRR